MVALYGVNKGHTCVIALVAPIKVQFAFGGVIAVGLYGAHILEVSILANNKFQFAIGGRGAVPGAGNPTHLYVEPL